MGAFLKAALLSLAVVYYMRAIDIESRKLAILPNQPQYVNAQVVESRHSTEKNR